MAKSTTIHATAIVDDAAHIGERVQVGPYVVIAAGAVIGDDCTIGSHVCIEGSVRMGPRNRVHQGAVLGGPPQDLKFRGESSLLVLGADNVVREYATLNVATGEGESTRVGEGCLLMAYTHVAHNCVLGNHVIMGNSVNLAGHVTVEDYAIISGVTPVHQFVRIGAHSYVGGGSRVPQDMPPFFLGAGNPMEIQGVNIVGLRRRGFSASSLRLLRECFRILYRSGLNTSQALDTIEAEMGEDTIAAQLVTFIRASERGITKST